MVAKFDMSVAFTIRCAECGREVKSIQNVPALGEIPMIGTPDGWILIDNLLYCQYHEISVDQIVIRESEKPKGSASRRRLAETGVRSLVTNG